MQAPSDQCQMLLEHASIGKSYGEAGLAHDIRLQSFGIDVEDNEFLIGYLYL